MDSFTNRLVAALGNCCHVTLHTLPDAIKNFDSLMLGHPSDVQEDFSVPTTNATCYCTLCRILSFWDSVES